MDRHSSLPGPHISDWEEFALDYLAGSLTGRALHEVEAHLAGCGDCRREIARQKSVLELLSSKNSLAEPPTDLAARVFSSLDEAELPAGAAEAGLAAGEAGGHAPTGRRTPRRPTAGPGWWQRLSAGFRRTGGAVWLPAAAALILVAVALTQVEGVFPGSDVDSSDTTSAAALSAESAAPDTQNQMDEEDSTAGEDRSSATTTRASSEAPSGGSATETVPSDSFGNQESRVLWVERSPDASWPAGKTASDRLAELTGLSPLPDDNRPQSQVYAVRVLTAEIDEVESRLLAEGFLAQDEAESGSADGEGPGETVTWAREAATQAPLLVPAENGAFEVSVPGAGDRVFHSEDYSFLVLVADD